MSNYGVLSEMVSNAGTVIAAAAAIGFAWMRRARWQPPQEAVPSATVKVSGLLCAVAIGVMYTFRLAIGGNGFLYISGISVTLVLIALLISIYINTTYSFEVPLNRCKDGRILGGYILTSEAKMIAAAKKLEHSALFRQANYSADLVWTRNSRAIVLMESTFSYIGLQVSGSIALSSTALLLGLITDSNT